MNKYLEQLIELSDFDKQIDSFLPKIESIEKLISSKQEEIDSIAKQTNDIEQEIKEIKVQISQTNLHIEEFSKRIKDTAKKRTAVKTERELKSLGIEDDLAKEQLNAANEEIAKLEKIIDTKNDLLNELKLKEESLKKDFDEVKSKSDLELNDIENLRNNLSSNKNKLLKDMDQKILSFYEKIRKWAKNSAVVPVKKQACYGCFLRINEKTYYSVLRGEEITTCPHCGRILYKDSSTQDEEAPTEK